MDRFEVGGHVRIKGLPHVFEVTAEPEPFEYHLSLVNGQSPLFNVPPHLLVVAKPEEVEGYRNLGKAA